jgi:pimeloyl-ACP methyl ester carboxylesterase
MRHVIVPIHGTWARNATWTAPEAPLSATLLQLLDEAVSEPFRWSGNNSHGARREAARQLREFIEYLTLTYEGAQLILIGHSHGGTVALYAMEDGKARARIKGLICLSTPFINVHSQPAFGALPAVFPELFAFAVALVFGLAVQARWVSTIVSTELAPRDVVQYANICCAFALTSVLARQAVTAGRKIADDLSVRPDASLPLLIMRCSGDEASAALATGQFCTWILRRFWQRCTWIAISTETYLDQKSPLTSVSRFLLFMVVVTLGVCAGVMFSGGGSQIRAELMARLSVAIFVPLLVSAIVVTCLIYTSAIQALYMVEWLLRAASTLVHPIAALFLLPFGPELAQASLVADVSVESSPPGCWEVYQVQPSSEQGDARAKLSQYLHSSLYENADAINYILQWIRLRFTSSETLLGEALLHQEEHSQVAHSLTRPA